MTAFEASGEVAMLNLDIVASRCKPGGIAAISPECSMQVRLIQSLDIREHTLASTYEARTCKGQHLQPIIRDVWLRAHCKAEVEDKHVSDNNEPS